MLLQELPKTEGFSDTIKFIGAVLFLVISNLVTYFATRPKSESEIRKNEADAHKSEADAMHTNISSITALTEELDEMITKTKGLRSEVATLEDIVVELKDAIRQAQLHENEEVQKLHLLFEEERSTLLNSIEKAIQAVSRMIDTIVSEGVSQDVRMKAVRILEMLYTVRDSLKSKG